MMGLQINKLHPEEIIRIVTAIYPEIPDVLRRVRERVPGIKREIATYQAAALYAAVAPLRGQGAHILEIGTAWGYSAAIMAEAAPDARIETLNPLPHEVEAAVKHLRHYPNVTVYCEKSWDYLKTYTGPKLDFIFVDGDHKRVRMDLPWYDQLAVGGSILFHDYAPAGTYRECPPVFEALNDFRKTLGTDFDFLIVDDREVGMAGFTKGKNMTAKAEAGQRDFDLGQAAGASILSYAHIVELYNHAKNIQELDGAIVECGVTNGGSAAAIYCGARQSPKVKRPIFLFDNFEGIPEPGPEDEPKIHQKWQTNREQGWCKGDAAAVRSLFHTLKINSANIHIFPGEFEERFSTGLVHAPDIAFLHVDATLYRSTKLALERFYNAVVPGGIISVAAYGHWEGVRKATDEFFQDRVPEFQFIDKVNMLWVIS